jgi:hypothetical protein
MQVRVIGPVPQETIDAEIAWAEKCGMDELIITPNGCEAGSYPKWPTPMVKQPLGFWASLKSLFS